MRAIRLHRLQTFIITITVQRIKRFWLWPWIQVCTVGIRGDHVIPWIIPEVREVRWKIWAQISALKRLLSTYLISAVQRVTFSKLVILSPVKSYAGDLFYACTISIKICHSTKIRYSTTIFSAQLVLINSTILKMSADVWVHSLRVISLISKYLIDIITSR